MTTEHKPTSERVTLKGAVLAEIVKGNPGQKIKSVEYGQYGDIRRIEWYEHDPDFVDEGKDGGADGLGL